MAATTIAEVQDQVQKYWSPMFVDELRASMLIGSLVNKEYDGQIKNGGDVVKVSQIVAPQGENRTVGVNASEFTTEQLQTLQVEVKADKRAVAGFEFDDLSQIQSQIGQQDSKIREALVYAVGKQINDYLYSLVAPSASAPDHIRNSITDYNKAELLAVRLLASQAKWGKAQNKYILADPSFYGDILGDTTLSSSEFTGDKPMVGGQLAEKRMGFWVLEDDGLAVDQAVAFHPDFLHLVTQTSVQFKISDLHANNKFAYKITADIIYGAKLGIGGSSKHILSCASASATSVVMA
jgi:hypothetical protein